MDECSLGFLNQMKFRGTLRNRVGDISSFNYLQAYVYPASLVTAALIMVKGNDSFPDFHARGSFDFIEYRPGGDTEAGNSSLISRTEYMKHFTRQMVNRVGLIESIFLKREDPVPVYSSSARLILLESLEYSFPRVISTIAKQRTLVLRLFLPFKLCIVVF